MKPWLQKGATVAVSSREREVHPKVPQPYTLIEGAFSFEYDLKCAQRYFCAVGGGVGDVLSIFIYTNQLQYKNHLQMK